MKKKQDFKQKGTSVHSLNEKGILPSNETKNIKIAVRDRHQY